MHVTKIPSGKNPPEEVNVFIEIPQGVSIKYEYDPEIGAVIVDRFLYTGMNYPFNYGFIPQTKGGDGDPLDIMVLSSKPVAVGVVIPARPIGMLGTKDEEGEDTKVIAVPMPKVDPKFAGYNELSDVPKKILDDIKYFFENYKKSEPGKWVKVSGWKGKKEALETVRKAMK